MKQTLPSAPPCGRTANANTCQVWMNQHFYRSPFSGIFSVVIFKQHVMQLQKHSVSVYSDVSKRTLPISTRSPSMLWNFFACTVRNVSRCFPLCSFQTLGLDTPCYLSSSDIKIKRKIYSDTTNIIFYTPQKEIDNNCSIDTPLTVSSPCLSECTGLCECQVEPHCLPSLNISEWLRVNIYNARML